MRIVYFSLLLILTGCSMIPTTRTQQVSVNGYSIGYISHSEEAPTVVFESGLGDGLSIWNKVYPQVETFASIFAYSRPGYPPSSFKLKFGEKRTAEKSADLLQALLKKTKTPAPYILVGQSIGGLYILEFARRYPELTAGLVLVDARLPGFTEKCEMADVGLCKPPTLIKLMSPPHVAAEIRGIPDSEANAPTPADIGDIPTTLIAATNPALGASSKAQPLWLETQKDFTDALLNGRFVIADGSGHYIQRDDPELVIEEIRKMVDELSK